MRGQKKWRVIIPANEPGGRRVQKLFETWEKANTEATRVNAERFKGRIEDWYHLSATDQAMMIAALRRAGSAEAVLAACNRDPEGVKAKKLSEAVEACIADRVEANRSEIYVGGLRWALERFARGQSQRNIGDVKAADVRAWLTSMGGAPDTRRGYLSKLRTLFAFAERNGWVKDNPAKMISMPERGAASPRILTVDECQRLVDEASKFDCVNEAGKPKKADKLALWKITHPPRVGEMLGYVGLCLFGGLRPSEARRIVAADIRGDFVNVSAATARKKKQRRLVAINPALRACLLAGAIPVPANWRKFFREIKKNAGLVIEGEREWDQDILRHTFVSYHNELHGWQETVKQAGHSLAMMLEHYREVVTKEQAEKFWEIRPPVV